MKIFQDYLYEDLLDDLNAEDRKQAKDIVIEQDEYDGYILLASDQQKAGFISKVGMKDYSSETDPQKVRQFIYEHLPKYYGREFYTIETLMNMCASFSSYQISFENYGTNTFKFDVNEVLERWPVDEFMRKDSKGRIECCEFWDQYDYYYTPHVAIRIDFIFNPNVSLKQFIKDMNNIHKNTVDSHLCNYLYMKRLDKSVPEGSVSIMPYIKDSNKAFIDAYKYLQNETEEYQDEEELMYKYRKNYKGMSPYVQYLMAFEKSNEKDTNSKYDFKMMGIEHEHDYNYKNDTYVLMMNVIPRDRETFDRNLLYEFLMKNIVYPMQKYNNKYYQSEVEIFIYSGGPYTEGLRENPETIATNVKIKDRYNKISVTYINPTYEIYPKGRKRVFHKLKNASLWICNWHHVLNHTLYY